jgi:ABC-2 type transport system permease protein
MKTLAWCVRRELWEHRWVYVAPAAGGLTLIGGFVVHGHAEILGIVLRALLIGGTLVAFVYCSEALHGERRDRSILFWKSVPVSDRVAVLSKALVAVAVVPAIILALMWLSQLLARGLIANGSAAPDARLVSPGWAATEMLATVLWQAPTYAWFLVVSGLARRAPLLWAMVAPTLVITIAGMVGAPRALGDAFASRGPLRHLPGPDALNGMPTRFDMGIVPAPALLSSGALWWGLAIAAALLALAAHLRRRRAAM